MPGTEPEIADSTVESQHAGQLFFDTLSSYDESISNFETGTELCDWIFGPFSVQRYCAAVISSPMTVTDDSVEWGSGREFDESIVYVRSSPPGRMGRPLLPKETRVISVLLICNATAHAKVSIFRIFLAEGMLPSVDDAQQLDHITPDTLSYNSFGPGGVPLTGLLVWESHLSTMQGGQRSVVAASSEGNHLITCSTRIVRKAPTKSGLLKHQHVERVVAGDHDFPVARILTGLRVDDRLRHAIEETTLASWVGGLTASMRKFGAELTEVGRETECGDALFAARMACDELGMAGTVDLMAADTSIGGLPDAYTRPYQMPLLLAVATRIAAYPHRFEQNFGTASDRFACAEIAACFEQTETPIVEAVEADESERHPLYAIDIVAKTACGIITEEFMRRKASCKKKESREVFIEEQLYLESMEAMMRAGISLSFDVAGPVTANVYGPFGFASRELDAACLTRQERASKLGAVPSNAAFAGPRLTQRAERQTTLLKILHDVETWLVTGVWRDAQINTPNDANPHLAWNRPGHGVLPSSERCSSHRVFSADAAEPEWQNSLCHDAIRVAQNELVQLLSHGPATTTDSYGIVSCIYGRHSTIPCADCPAKLTPHESFGFGGTASFCAQCSRRRCLNCQRAPDVHDRLNCMRCLHVNHPMTPCKVARTMQPSTGRV